MNSIRGSATFRLRELWAQATNVDRAALVLSSWFGVGIIPVIPGTFGTLGAIPLILGLSLLGKWAGLIALVVLIVLGVWASGRTEKVLGRTDPSLVVIDEVAGFLVTLLLLPITWLTLLSGFVLFRLFDIFKPWPAGQAEALKGGWGIVADDLIAGLYAHLGVSVILLLAG